MSLANPAAYGITRHAAGLPDLPGADACSPGCLVNSAGYLFYVDGLHLTSDGFAIVAQYVAAQLTAPLVLQAPSDLGLDVARQFGRTLTSRMDTRVPARWRHAERPALLRASATLSPASRTPDLATFPIDVDQRRRDRGR